MKNLKVLIVCSKNSGRVVPFIGEQAEALKKKGIEVNFYTVTGKGTVGYLKNLPGLVRKIDQFRPDVVHAHYGLSGLLSNLQRKIPVITTYHGSDINHTRPFRYSKLAIRLSAHNIFVSAKNMQKGGFLDKASLVPCGVDLDLFYPKENYIFLRKQRQNLCNTRILFGGAFGNQVKNPSLAKQAVAALPGATLTELKGYSRKEVAELINASDILLLTSYSEGSPQIVKEAMACNCPIVATDVGDIRELTSNVKGCFITGWTVEDVVQNIRLALDSTENMGQTDGRQRIISLKLDSVSVAERLIRLYEQVIAECR